ncbi:MAG: hypothetical protein NTY46_04475 [Candidatus Sumerlaeota bacterium]|nr:hypothetical protein [Candidatus Sumerlaeota bacterium]
MAEHQPPITCVLRNKTKGVLGRVAQTVGVSLPPDLREGEIER